MCVYKNRYVITIHLRFLFRLLLLYYRNAPNARSKNVKSARCNRAPLSALSLDRGPSTPLHITNCYRH